ncbi:uncharacterized protein SAPINGB_P006155 [Magnusiomyces paraingens]|uniref:Uncharacterized protein n=1 Tax=Magnusiomyces paraingens TaxID=2606893 RepID=A0A5E8CAN9_9ASCO|nr:uncharacterized protein SAPINGB_P006155 [Saprochaete ingens]VVT58336.1 unnamed protein product [Saprochaete ingens]
MSIFNIVQAAAAASAASAAASAAAADGPRDPWASHTRQSSSSHLGSSSTTSSSSSSSSITTPPALPQQIQPQFNRRSVSLSASMNTFPSLSSQAIDEEPILSHHHSDLSLALSSPSPLSSVNQIDRQISNSININNTNTNNNNNNNSLLTNGNSGTKPTVSGGSNNVIVPSSPFNIPPPTAFHEPQRRFTWTTTSNNNTLVDLPVTNLSNAQLNSGGNNNNNNISSSSSNNNNSFATSGLLSSLPKYRDSAIIPPGQQQQQQQHQQASIPIQQPTSNSYQQQQQPQQIQNIGILLKRLDDTVFELKSEFRLLYQENERLRYQLKCRDEQQHLQQQKPLQQPSCPTSPHFDAQLQETLKKDLLHTLATPVAPPTLTTSTSTPSANTQPGAIGSKPVSEPTTVKQTSLPTQTPKQPIHEEQNQYNLPTHTSQSQSQSQSPPIDPSKKVKLLKKDQQPPSQLHSTTCSTSSSTSSPAYSSRYEKPRYSSSSFSTTRSPPEYHPSPFGYEAVVYGVEKSLTMDQIRDDLEANDVILACTPRPLMRADKSSPLPVHSVVITLVDEDTFRQCIEHSLPINYSMRRVKALRSHPRSRKRGGGSGGGGGSSSSEWRSVNSHRVSYENEPESHVDTDDDDDDEDDFDEE